jgi:tol-pal system beta propeller repeat protein TolB
MNTRKISFGTLDILLLIGLGCGVIGLCVLAGGFIYTFRNPPNARPSATPVAQNDLTMLPPVSITPSLTLGTPTLFPTLTITPEDALIPSALPNPGNSADLQGKIVFTCYIQQIDQICLMNADGSGRKQLTSFDATSFYASLSPDGEIIYFVSRKDGAFEIYSMNLKGKDVERLTRGIGTVYAPELSPTGERIVFTNNGNGIWVMRPDGGNPHAITTRDDIDPTWSPDGSMIAFASSRSGKRQLYVMEKNGSDIRQITDLNDMGGRSTWSPDGKWLAFYRGPAGDHNIYIVNVETGEVNRLTNGGDNLGPSWSPYGNWIAFTSFRDGNNEIYVIHPDGTGLTRLTNSPVSDWQPRWGK